MLPSDDLPRMFPAVQRFPRPRLDDVAAAVAGELERILPPGSPRLRPGARIGLTAGSRGIAGIDRILRAAAEFLKARGARPFILPAMGSHGGATAEGQRAIIAHYGVTEEAMGCPILSDMDTLSLGRGEHGVEAFIARSAWEADGVILLNRVKPHTDFKGTIESGLAKICAIGLGKIDGARECHTRIFDIGLERSIRSVAARILATGKVIGGAAILENAYHETARIAGVLPEALFETEEGLLRQARGLCASLPFQEVDLLICDFLGKNISGAGFDTNIIGRCIYGYIGGVPWKEGMPSILRILVRGVTEESDGNAVGMGLADFATSKFFSRVNRSVSELNSFTSRAPLGSRPPIALSTDLEAIRTALSTCPLRPEGPRIIHIRDTLHLETVLLSEAFLPAARNHPQLAAVGEPEPFRFDPEGWLLSPFAGHDPAAGRNPRTAP